MPMPLIFEAGPDSTAIPTWMPPEFDSDAEVSRYHFVTMETLDPEGAPEGIVDIPTCIAELTTQFAAIGGPPAYCMVNSYESLSDVVFYSCMENGPEGADPLWAPMLANLCDLFDALAAEWPETKFTYYQLVVPHWADPEGDFKDWAAVTDEERPVFFERILRAFRNGEQGLPERLGWVCPSIYPVVDTTSELPPPPESMDPPSYFVSSIAEATAAQSRASVDIFQYYFELHDIAPEDRPEILPVATPYYWFEPYGVHYKPVAVDDIVDLQIVPALEAGADGIAFYLGVHHPFLTMANPPDPLSEASDLWESLALVYYPEAESWEEIDWTSSEVHDELYAIIEPHIIEAMGGAAEAMQTEEPEAQDATEVHWTVIAKEIARRCDLIAKELGYDVSRREVLRLKLGDPETYANGTIQVTVGDMQRVAGWLGSPGFVQWEQTFTVGITVEPDPGGVDNLSDDVVRPIDDDMGIWSRAVNTAIGAPDQLGGIVDDLFVDAARPNRREDGKLSGVTIEVTAKYRTKESDLADTPYDPLDPLDLVNILYEGDAFTEYGEAVATLYEGEE